LAEDTAARNIAVRGSIHKEEGSMSHWLWIALGVATVVYNGLYAASIRGPRLIVIGTDNLFGPGTYLDIGYLLIAWGIIRYFLTRRRKQEQ
jgi:alanine-alpha-ketoisovalerate/valine-pyruvate aminotransferase